MVKIDLSKKVAIRRVRFFLEYIDEKQDQQFLLMEVDHACGRRIRPLSKLLWSCFRQVGWANSHRNEWNEYIPIKRRVQEIRDIYTTHANNTALGAE